MESTINSRACALCGQHLSKKNKTREHIIPNAIGGRMKATGFICNHCNNKRGETWDAELAKQLSWLSLAIGIVRERGESPRQLVETVSGERFWQHKDGSFTPKESTYTEEKLGEAVRIHLIAKTPEEAKLRLNGILRKYPKLDIDQAIKNLETKTNYLDSPLRACLKTRLIIEKRSERSLHHPVLAQELGNFRWKMLLKCHRQPLL